MSTDIDFAAVVGGANMDICGATDGALIPGDSNPGHIRCTPGGVARNVAENLARLGNATRLLTVVGDDDFGRAVLGSTRLSGVDVDGSRMAPEEATSSYLSVHGLGGDMAVAVNDMRIMRCITPQWLTTQAPRLRGAQALVLDCNLEPPALAWLMGFAKDESVPVFVDTVSAAKCQRIKPFLAQVQTLKVNRLEAGVLSGVPVEDDAGIEVAARRLHEQGVRNVVISLGERGVYWRATTEPSQVAACGWKTAPPCAVANVTGAGDALMAGLVHAHMRHLALETGLPFALACAALTLQAETANNPGLTVAAVEQFVNQSLNQRA